MNKMVRYAKGIITSFPDDIKSDVGINFFDMYGKTRRWGNKIIISGLNLVERYRPDKASDLMFEDATLDSRPHPLVKNNDKYNKRIGFFLFSKKHVRLYHSYYPLSIPLGKTINRKSLIEQDQGDFTVSEWFYDNKYEPVFQEILAKWGAMIHGLTGCLRDSPVLMNSPYKEMITIINISQSMENDRKNIEDKVIKEDVADSNITNNTVDD